MPIYTTPVSQLQPADLQELLDGAAVENIRLEFKLQVPTKDETLKKLSSFANTFGGLMVIGAKANSADGRIEDLPGVDEESGYKQKVVQWCFDGASPPLVVGVSDPIPTPSGNGKVCYVVYVAESDVAPHFLNGRRGIWVRTDEFSARFEAHLADENELRHLFDRRKLIQERREMLLDRGRKRFDTYIASQPRKAAPSGRILSARLNLWVVPHFPSRPLCEQEKINRLMEKKWFPWRQALFPMLGAGVISQQESAIILQATGEPSMCEANVWGMLFYGTQIDREHNGTFGIHPYEVAGYVLLFIRHAAEMLKELGYSGLILIKIVLTSVLKAPWLDPRGGMGFSVRSGSVLDDEVVFSIDVSGDILRETPDRIAINLLRHIFLSVDWPDMVDTPEKLDELVRMGHKYNS